MNEVVQIMITTLLVTVPVAATLWRYRKLALLSKQPLGVALFAGSQDNPQGVLGNVDDSVEQWKYILEQFKDQQRKSFYFLLVCLSVALVLVVSAFALSLLTQVSVVSGVIHFSAAAVQSGVSVGAWKLDKTYNERLTKWADRRIPKTLPTR